MLSRLLVFCLKCAVVYCGGAVFDWLLGSLLVVCLLFCFFV